MTQSVCCFCEQTATWAVVLLFTASRCVAVEADHQRRRVLRQQQNRPQWKTHFNIQRFTAFFSSVWSLQTFFKMSLQIEESVIGLTTSTAL